MMRRNSTVVMAVIALAIIAGSALVLGPINRAYAHVFRGSDSSTFLTMIQEVKVETALAENNTSSSSDKQVASTHIESAAQALSNSTLKEIAERNQRIAKDLPAAIGQLKTSISSGATADQVKENVQTVSDLLDEATQVRIEREQLSNTTVQATVVSNLVNKALDHYGKAVAFQGNMTDMSAMASMSGASKSTSSMSNGGSGSSVQMNMSGGSNMNMAAPTTTTRIVGQADYQSALAFAQKAQDMYEQQIKTKALSGKENAVKALDSAFPAFVKAIKDKSSAMDVMMVAHLKVHPNLMEAYGLTMVG